MKKSLFMIPFVFLLFSASAFAQTGTYTGSSSLDVHIDAGIGLTDSSFYAAIYTKSDGSTVDPSPDGDYWVNATVGGSLAQGAIWGFKYFDPSSNTWIHVGNFSSPPSGAIDLTQLGIAPPEPASLGIWVDDSNATGSSWVYMTQVVSHDGAIINFPGPSGYTSGSPAPPPVTVGVSVPPPPSAGDIGQAVAKALSDFPVPPALSNVSSPTLTVPVHNGVSVPSTTYTPLSIKNNQIPVPAALPTPADLNTAIPTGSTPKAARSAAVDPPKPSRSDSPSAVKNPDSPHVSDVPKAARFSSPSAVHIDAAKSVRSTNVSVPKVPSGSLGVDSSLVPSAPISP